MQRDEFITHNRQQIHAIHMGYWVPSDWGSLHPPIRSTGRSFRSDSDQIQELNGF